MTHRLPSILLASVLASTALLTSDVSADCVGCFEIMRARAEFKDGTKRIVYFEWYSSMPIVEASDGTQLITIGQDYLERREWIRLIDTVFQFEDITTATVPGMIDTVKTSDIERLVFLDKTGFGAWGQINVYDTTVIRMMSVPPFARYSFPSSGERILLSYNSEVSVQRLEQLADYYHYQFSGNDRLANIQMLCRQGFPSESERVSSLRSELRRYLERLAVDRHHFDSIAGHDPVGRFFARVVRNIDSHTDFVVALEHYLASNRADEFRRDLTLIFSTAKQCTAPEFSLDSAHVDHIPQILGIVTRLRECFPFEQVGDANYRIPYVADSLATAGVVLVFNESD